MVVAGCCTGLEDTVTAEDLELSDVEVGGSLEPWAVEARQAFRTGHNRRGSSDHNDIDPVLLLSEGTQIGRWQGKDQKGLEQHSCLNGGADPLLNAAVWENCVLQMKKIEDLLVEAPCLGDNYYMGWNSRMVAAQSSEDFPWGPGQAVGEPAANVLKLDFEPLGVASSETVVRAFDWNPDTESCSDCLGAGLGVV